MKKYNDLKVLVENKLKRRLDDFGEESSKWMEGKLWLIYSGLKDNVKVMVMVILRKRKSGWVYSMWLKGDMNEL